MLSIFFSRESLPASPYFSKSMAFFVTERSISAPSSSSSSTLVCSSFAIVFRFATSGIPRPLSHLATADRDTDRMPASSSWV